MIPKIIHYCWFGENPLPESALKCIESWKRFLTDYEIKEWNETNFDLNCCDYVKEAYAAKKWAFVSDYVRFRVLYDEGGIYFDTDVELIASIDDIIERGPFLGMEGNNVAPGLGLSANPGLGLLRDVLDHYESIHFVNETASGDLDNVVTYTTDILRKKGFVGGKEIECIDGVWIYPPEYFDPMEFITGKITITENTKSIHHYSASWFTDKEKKRLELQHKLAEKYKRINWESVFNSGLWKVIMNVYAYGMKKTIKKVFSYFCGWR